MNDLTEQTMKKLWQDPDVAPILNTLGPGQAVTLIESTLRFAAPKVRAQVLRGTADYFRDGMRSPTAGPAGRAVLTAIAGDRKSVV